MRIRIVAALLVAWVAAAPLAAAPSRLPPERDTWRRGDSAHFVFYTNADERRVRELGENLERLVDLLAKRAGSKASPVPTAIYVFRDDKSFQPYKRNPDGSVKSLSGFFVPDDLSNYVALDGSTPTPGIVLHEYLHQFCRYNFPPLPAWLSEGLAEFYSTFSTTDRMAEVGRPVQEHVLWLRANKLIPLSRLFAVTTQDSEYNEQSKQGVFYAESWALAHLLLVGNQERRGQVTDYMSRLDQGQSPQKAVAAFGDLGALQKELEAYVKRNAFVFRKETFEGSEIETSVAFTPLSREETLFRLGDLLLHSSELRDDAAEHFRAALALAPKHGGAMGGLALIEAAAGRWPQAVAGFERAVAATPEDADLRLRLAEALYRAEFEASAGVVPSTTPQRILLAREHAAKAVALRPDSFDSQFILGLTYQFQDEGVEPGIAAMERAQALAPGRADVMLTLGALQMRAERLDEAKASFEEVVRSASEPEFVVPAKESLAEIAVLQAFAELERTQDVEKAVAAIRAALPNLEASRRVEVEKHLKRLEAFQKGGGDEVEAIPAPPLASDDLEAHLVYAMQRGNASQRTQGEGGDRLATEAVQHFRRATQIDATSPDAWIGLAAFCPRAGCPRNEGEQAAERGWSLRPGDPLGAYILAEYWIKSGRDDQVREMLAPLLDIEGPMRDQLRLLHVRARIAGAMALIEAGAQQDALKLLDAGPLPEGKDREFAEKWIAGVKEDALQSGSCDLLAATRVQGQREKKRKMLADIVARCPDKEVVKMARFELERMGK